MLQILSSTPAFFVGPLRWRVILRTNQDIIENPGGSVTARVVVNVMIDCAYYWTVKSMAATVLFGATRMPVARKLPFWLHGKLESMICP